MLGIHRSPVNSPHKWPVTRKMFPFDDVIINWHCCSETASCMLIISQPMKEKVNNISRVNSLALLFLGIFAFSGNYIFIYCWLAKVSQVTVESRYNETISPKKKRTPDSLSVNSWTTGYFLLNVISFSHVMLYKCNLYIWYIYGPI